MKKASLSCILFLLPSLGFAHAHLKNAEPAKDAIIDKLPSKIVLTFSEDLELSMSKIEVRRKDNKTLVSSGNPANSGQQKNIMEIELKAPLAEKGTYEVSWKAVGTDSHPMKGSYLFTVSSERK